MVFDRNLKTSFLKTGSFYHKARPEYPKKLINYIIQNSVLPKESQILDIGCGTGKSTIPFNKTNASILGIDISKSMLAEAKSLSKKHKNISYKRSSFESLKCPKNSFDLILAGTSFHWLSPSIRYKKIHRLLKPKGYLAIFWGIEAYNKSKICKELREIYKRNSPYYPMGYSSSDEKLVHNLKSSGYFEEIKLKIFLNKENLTRNQLLNLISSYSWIMALDEEKKGNLIRELKDLLKDQPKKIVIPRKYKVILAKRGKDF